MRALTWLVLLVVALSAVLVFAGLVGKETDVSYRLLPATCAISIIGVPLFLLLAARQSRKDREEREQRFMREQALFNDPRYLEAARRAQQIDWTGYGSVKPPRRS